MQLYGKRSMRQKYIHSGQWYETNFEISWKLRKKIQQ